MKNYVFLLCLSVCLWVQPVSALENPAAMKYRQGLLWKVSAEGLPESYLFGTMHSEDAGVLSLAGIIEPYLRKTKQVCTEVLFDFRSQDKVSEVMFFPDGQTLNPIIGPSLFEQSVRALSTYGYSRDTANQLRPWAVIMILSNPDSLSPQILDVIVADKAWQLDIPVCGLEDVTEQVGTISGMHMDEQVALLRGVLDMQTQLPVASVELKARYLRRDLAGLVALSQKYALKDEALWRKYWHRVLDERNERMVERMLPRMLKHSVFFAVGALHLPGDSGLLRRLERAGYKVKAIY